MTRDPDTSKEKLRDLDKKLDEMKAKHYERYIQP